MEKELNEKNIEIGNLKTENEALRKDKTENDNEVTVQELHRLRTMVQDREKAIKKASENHKKELMVMERAKKNAEENLNSITGITLLSDWINL